MIRYSKLLLLLTLSVVLFGGCRSTATKTAGPVRVTVTDAAGQPVGITDTSRIVSCNTATTETLIDLGVADRIVGVDGGSHNYLPAIEKVPQVGSMRALAPEGIVSLNPSLVIINSDAGPPEVIDQLRKANITVLTLPAAYTLQTVKDKTMTLAKALELDAKGTELVAKIDSDMAEVNAMLSKTPDRPRAIFCGRGPNMPNATAAGTGTTVDEMIKLAGGVNAMTQFEGFRPMTDEAVVEAAPDILIMTERGYERSGGADGVVKFPGVAQTPAGKNRRFIPVSDMYFMGFGTGVGKAVKELALKIHAQP